MGRAIAATAAAALLLLQLLLLMSTLTRKEGRKLMNTLTRKEGREGRKDGRKEVCLSTSVRTKLAERQRKRERMNLAIRYHNKVILKGRD
jgi:hypothetical protein